MKQVKISTNVGYIFQYSTVSASVKSNSTISIPQKTLFWDSNTFGCLAGLFVCLFVFLGYYYLSFGNRAGLSPQDDLAASLCRHDSRFTNTFPFLRVVGRFWPEDNCLNHPQCTFRMSPCTATLPGVVGQLDMLMAQSCDNIQGQGPMS